MKFTDKPILLVSWSAKHPRGEIMTEARLQCGARGEWGPRRCIVCPAALNTMKAYVCGAWPRANLARSTTRYLYYCLPTSTIVFVAIKSTSNTLVNLQSDVSFRCISFTFFCFCCLLSMEVIFEGQRVCLIMYLPI